MICQRDDHCSFSRLDKNGKCVARCEKNKLVDGFYVDCIGKRSETMSEYEDRLNSERQVQ